MPRRPTTDDDVSNPEQIIQRMILDYVEGRLGDAPRIWYRAIVVDIDTQGGQFELEPPNPPGAIRARVLTNGYNAATRPNDLPIFWPKNPFHITPIKEKEHVYVSFEDEERQHGLWHGRIPHSNDVESQNFVNGVTPYVQNAFNHVNAGEAEQIVSEAMVPIETVDISEDFTQEDVPPFHFRVGDHFMLGSNNTLIWMGRDRLGASPQTDKAGTIDIVVGRSDAAPSPDDKARVYVSSNTNLDQVFSLTNVGGAGEQPVNPSSAQPVSHAGMVADQIRIIARNGMKIVVTGGDVTIEGANINIGSQASHNAVLGDMLKTLLDQILTQLQVLTVTCAAPGSPSSPPVNFGVFQSIQQTLDTILSQTVKVKQ